jgi:hypothetical protein
LNAGLDGVSAPPQVETTWSYLYPDPVLLSRDRAARARADEWLALAQLLARRDPAALERFGFPEREQGQLEHLVRAASRLVREGDDGARDLARSILARICELAPDYAGPLPIGLLRPEDPAAGRWWVPEDIAAPPSTEPVATRASDFSRDDVARVLSDL